MGGQFWVTRRRGVVRTAQVELAALVTETPQMLPAVATVVLVEEQLVGAA